MSTGTRRTRGSNSFEPVAGNGLLDRRALLGGGLALAGAMGTGVSSTGAAAEPLKDAPWSLEIGAVTPPLQTRVAVRETRRPCAQQSSERDADFACPHAASFTQRHGHAQQPALHHQSFRNSGYRPGTAQARHPRHGEAAASRSTLESLSRYPLVTRMTFVECSGNSGAMFSNEPIQATAGALHGLASNARMDRRAALDPARRGRHRSEGEMADRRRRRFARACTAACR